MKYIKEDHYTMLSSFLLSFSYLKNHDCHHELESQLGNASSHILFDKIIVEKNSNIIVPRKFTDYTITVNKAMPEGVTFIEKL